MQEFDHTYTKEELECPYFDECYIQVRNQGACRYNCQDNPAYRKEYVPVQDFGMAMVNRKRGKRR